LRKEVWRTLFRRLFKIPHMKNKARLGGEASISRQFRREETHKEQKHKQSRPSESHV